jgi:3-oxoacyl-[acyl-carrier protein] reductase
VTRSVVISGGGTGIGRCVARAFARGGDAITILGRRSAPLAEAAAAIGPTVMPLVCDVSDPRAVMACLEHLPARIDVVVNAAGSNMATRGAPPQDLTAVSDMWMGNLRSNLMTAVVLTSALLDRVGENGRIIGFSSMAARSGGPGSHGYGAAKAAVEAWAKAISAEVGPRGITVNVVAPGLTDETDFFPVSLSASSREKLIMSADNRRAGRPDDVAAAVMFLASPAAGHITGHVLPVNGGVAFAR